MTFLYAQQISALLDVIIQNAKMNINMCTQHLQECLNFSHGAKMKLFQHLSPNSLYLEVFLSFWSQLVTTLFGEHCWVNGEFTLTARYSKCSKGYFCMRPRSPRIWLWLNHLTRSCVSTGVNKPDKTLM